MMGGMKQTGIRWIGEIPSDWNTKRIKYMATLKGRIGWQGLTSEEYQDEGAYLITGVDFLDGGINWEQCEHVPMKRWEEAKDIQIQNGDLLITKDGTVGKVAIVSAMLGETSLNSGVLRIIPVDGYSRRFLYWVLQSEVFWNWFNFRNAGNSTIVHLYQGDFAEFVYAFPDYNEQERIADYLDNECAKLDEIISTVQQQIDTLQTYRNSCVSETITKGLKSDVQMRDSGIPWVGSIPAHWSLKRLKYMLEAEDSMRVGPFGSALSTDEYVEEGKWVYTQRVVLDNNFTENDAFISEEKYKELKGFRVKAGDILLTTRGTIGRTAIVPDSPPEGILHPCIIRFRMNKDVLIPELAQLIFNESDFVRKQFAYMSNATTIEVIYSYSLKEILLPVIPKTEQIEILSFLQNRLAEIDEILLKKKEQLSTVQKHKASLIFEYVTGKKRVKEVV